MEPELVLEEISPHGNLQAIVEDDVRVVYFYLRGDPDGTWGLKNCWVRNRLPAPEALDVAGMRDGKPPLIPVSGCNHPRGAPALCRDQLRIVWFEEGDGAALFEGDAMLAVIPGWSGEGGFDGYARDSISTEFGTWPLQADNTMHERVHRAAEFWKQSDTWTTFQSQYLDVIESRLGKHDKYFAIDGGQWPPKALLQIPSGNDIILITLGMALRPQPAVEQYAKDPAAARRIEIACVIARQIEPQSIKSMGGWMSSLSASPWKLFTWYGPGHTIDAPPVIQSQFKAAAAIFSESNPAFPEFKLPEFRGDSVKTLWLEPLTQAELSLVRSQNSAALFHARTDFENRKWHPILK